MRQGLKFDGNLRPFEPDDADDDVTHGVSLCSAVGMSFSALLHAASDLTDQSAQL